MKKYTLDQEGIELERVQWADIYQEIVQKKVTEIYLCFQKLPFLGQMATFCLDCLERTLCRAPRQLRICQNKAHCGGDVITASPIPGEFPSFQLL